MRVYRMAENGSHRLGGLPGRRRGGLWPAQARGRADAATEPDAERIAPAEAGAEAAPEADGGLPKATLSALLDDWPRVHVGVESRAVSSFDRTGGNDDGFNGTFSELYTSGGEHVIFDAVGPGRLDTLWFTSSVSGTSPLGIGRVRIIVDDRR